MSRFNFNNLPGKWEICPSCDGNGKHVNPAVDGHGISPEEFAEDPDFAEAYFGGVYDVRCDECGGDGKVRVVDVARCSFAAKRLLVEARRSERWAAESRAEARHEARMLGEH
jgi:RecJ-like exonuclease